MSRSRDHQGRFAPEGGPLPTADTTERALEAVSDLDLSRSGAPDDTADRVPIDRWGRRWYCRICGAVDGHNQRCEHWRPRPAAVLP